MGSDLTPEELAEIRRRQAFPHRRFTTRQVPAHLQALGEAITLAGLNSAQAMEPLNRLQDAETPSHSP